MGSKTLMVFMISLLWAGAVPARKNFLYDYKEATMPVEGGVMSFRLIGANTMEDEPNKIRLRSNPYTLSIRYIADIPFDYAVISNLKFIDRDENKLIFEHAEKRASRGGGSGAGYAGFYYGDISKAINLNYVDYLIKGTMVVYGSNRDPVAISFEAVLEKDYKEKTTWDFWEGIMGI